MPECTRTSPGPGLGDDDLAHLDRRALRARHHTLHGCQPCRQFYRTAASRAPGGDPSRRRRAPRCARRRPRAEEDVVDLAVRTAAGHVRPRTVRRHPGRNARTPGPQKLQSPVTTAGPPGCGSCGRSRRSWIGGPVGQARREVDADEVDGGAVDVELDVERRAFGRGVGPHRDRPRAAAARRGAGR